MDDAEHFASAVLLEGAPATAAEGISRKYQGGRYCN